MSARNFATAYRALYNAYAKTGARNQPLVRRVKHRGEGLEFIYRTGTG